MNQNSKFTNWRKSSRSSGGDNCVEVASTGGPGGVVGVRDSKQHGHGPVLSFTPSEWRAFIDAVKAGEFDLS